MSKFNYFIILAGMRTGSNFLEANLNAMEGLACYGEAFNPHFIGYPNKTELLGITRAERDKDPHSLLTRMKQVPNSIAGFRFFFDHEPRILEDCLKDPKCAKIILTRNPVDSYVSWKIAQETGQWKLSDAKARKEAKATFDKEEFKTHLGALQDFQLRILNSLQVSGQTGFYLAYEDLQNLDVMNGLARFLGAEGALPELDKKLKKQNPSPISEKVANFPEMEAALSGLDRFNLTRTPNFEPRRGPNVPSYVAAAQSALLYLPIKGGVEDRVTQWLARIDGVAPSDLLTDFSQKQLRQWKRQHPGHRSFTVLRHPVVRAHFAFCQHILNTGRGSYKGLRQTLRRRYKLPIPENMPDAGYDRAAHHRAFLAFLHFLKGNLSAQTSIRVDATWCTQAQALEGLGSFAFPDRVIREEELAVELPQILSQIGGGAAVDLTEREEDTPFSLAQIYDAEIENATQSAYQRDYMMFGFTDWTGGV